MTKRTETDDAEIYRIKVSGKLNENWSDWFNGMTIVPGLEADKHPTTILIGPVTDQSALHGLLDKIRDLGLQLLLVERVLPEQDRNKRIKELK